MTWAERSARADARFAGLQAVSRMKQVETYAHQASQWATIPDCEERVAYWTKRMNEAEEDAVRYAVRAAHHLHAYRSHE